MKRIISVCIVLVLLNVVYVFTWNVGNYSSKEIMLCMTEAIAIEIPIVFEEKWTRKVEEIEKKYADAKAVAENLYQIEEKSFSNLNEGEEECVIDIHYPQILCDSDSSICTKINQSIKEEIRKQYDISGEICSYEIDYEIKYQGQDYLSILFYGMQMPLGLAHPSEIPWGITYDMETGQLVSITDVIELSVLQTKMEQKEFESQRGIEIKSYEAAAGEVDWFQKYMQLSMNYEDENHHYDFYLTKDKIGILYAVSHAIGDYIIVEIDKPNSQFTCEKVSDGYELNLYSKSKEKVFSAIYPKKPGIKEVSEDILQISISVGSPACYVFYFNEANAEISETFFNPIYFGDKYVAYMENEKLVLKDIFDEGLVYKEIERDFTKTVDPISAIIKIEMLNDGNILLKYYREDYVERTEVIEILEE